MIKSRVGLLFGAAGLLFAFSPEARRAARKLAVRGTEMFLDINDQIKARTKHASIENILDRSEESNRLQMETLSSDTSPIS